jgi:hypothetical protein
MITGTLVIQVPEVEAGVRVGEAEDEEGGVIDMAGEGRGPR